MRWVTSSCSRRKALRRRNRHRQQRAYVQEERNNWGKLTQFALSCATRISRLRVGGFALGRPLHSCPGLIARMYQADAQSLLLAGRWTRWAWNAWSETTSTVAVPDHGTGFHADVIARSGLGTLVARTLQRCGDPRAEWLGPIVRDTTAANLMRRAELQPLYTMLTDRGIRWCLLKGAASMQRFSELTALRRMTDIDLLVHADDFAHVTQLLIDERWRRVDMLGPASSRWVCEHTWQQQRSILVELDVHRGLHHPPIARALTSQLLADAQVVGGLPVPSRSTALLHLSLHRTKSGWQGHAAELLDARLLANSLSDAEFEQLAELARGHRLLNSLSIVLLATHWWLGEVPLREQWLLQQLPPKIRDRVVRLAMMGARAMPIQAFRPAFLKMYAGMVYADGPRPEQMIGIVVHGVLRTLDTLVPVLPPWLPVKK
jgi:hypothetical protein